MDIAADLIRRLSWKSIEDFGQSFSGMESLVDGVANQQVRKNRMYSAFASLFVVLVFCYIVATFFFSEEKAAAAEDGIPDDESSGYVPKFLIPFHFVPT
jgi:hypothetical protein